ncbi:MAG: DNA cytosine methyltransferase, partial [Promethearchaeota archaeon]
MFRILDLFCGAGGFALGFQKAGFEIICGIDKDSLALT